MRRTWTRIRLRSIRARVTAGSMAVMVVVLAVTITAVSLLTRDLLWRDVVDQAAVAARQVVGLVQEDRLSGDIPPQNGVVRLQVVDARADVVASSAALRGYGPLSDLHPSGADSRVEGTVCRSEELSTGCLIVVGFLVEHSSYGEVMVYAAVTHPPLLSGHLLEAVLTVAGLALLAASGWVTWVVAGRTLRPVERIRADLERLTLSDLGRRLPVPDTDDELAELARTGNDSLDRLEGAMARQRSFVSDASHELRNPIAAMRTRLEVELSDPTGGDPQSGLRAALDDTERLQRIVSDLLDLARLDSDVSTVREPVDLGELAADEVARHSGGKEIETALDPGIVVRGNPIHLARVLVNLLANAERHARGRVRVSVTAGGDRTGTAVLAVHDDGHGVAPRDRERIFGRFSRLDESRRRDPGGTGLGLAISREIAVAHGGSLDVGESADLGGAVFTLRLPRSDGVEGTRDTPGPHDHRE